MGLCDAQDWLAGIASAAEEGQIKPGDVAYVYGDTEAIERRLQAPAALDVDGFVAEVKKARGKGKILSPAALHALKDGFAETVVPLKKLAAEAVELERHLSDCVNGAFGLTPEEVALLWKTAPPRMPVTPSDPS